jgi:DNA helicase-2/ATP-dependent DNA helicase PcrA
MSIATAPLPASVPSLESARPGGGAARPAGPVRAAPDPFEALNEAQRAAVEHGLGGDPRDAGPVLVIAGAGTGKTLTLASRVARLVLAGADPQRLLLLTFSRRAALEMERRVGRVLHQALGFASTQRAPSLPWAGTFHAVGARLLREYAGRIGLAEAFTVDDRADSEDLMHWVRQDLGLAATKNRFPAKGTCLAIYSRVVNSRMRLADVLQQVFPWCSAWHDELKRLFAAYAAEKERQQVLDYDDLLLYVAAMLGDAGLAAEIGSRFDHVLVDEYQDTNRLQAGLLLALKPDGRGLTVVGDDAQSIYSFRAAEVRNILDFPAAFEPPARIVTLTRNYRSTPPILDASNGVIALAAERHPKELTSLRVAAGKPVLAFVVDESEQARWVADEVLRQREAGLALKAQAVLFRTSHHSAPLELELARRGIPFTKFGGLKFLEAAHVRDVLAVLRLAQNPRGQAACLRVAQLVPGVGPASARRLADALRDAPDPALAFAAFVPPAVAREAWGRFAALHAELGAAEAAWAGQIERVIGWYAPHLERLHDDSAARAADLAQLARLSSGYPSRERFLTELTLDPPDATSDESGPPQRDEDYLVLSTIHSAKGQEWSAVYLLNAVDGCMPSDLATGSAAEIEEERRLLYVAMTRAKDHLGIVVPQRFYVHQQSAFGDRHVYGTLTRFIPAGLQPCFEHVVPAQPAQACGLPGAQGPAIDVSARVRSIWA